MGMSSEPPCSQTRTSLHSLLPHLSFFLLSPSAAPPAPVAPPALTPTASILQATAQTAHKAFANLASAAPLKVGDAVPDVEVKINDMEEKINLSKLTGKNVFVLVPGAYVLEYSLEERLLSPTKTETELTLPAPPI